MFNKKDKNVDIKDTNSEKTDKEEFKQPESKINSFKNIKNSDDSDTKEETNSESNSKDSEKIKELEEENKKLKDTLMSTLAELDNTRRRSIEENQKTAKYAIGKFAEELIPVMENFYLAFNSINGLDKYDEKTSKNFIDGIKLTQNELKKVFERNGLVRIYPLNENFNPDLHNAITQIESDQEDGKIIEVMQAGYTIKDRLLRPALVCVSKFKGDKNK